MQLKKVINHGNSRWRVSLYIEGKRIQRFFASKDKALQWIKELNSDQSHDFFWSKLNGTERQRIISAYDLAKHKNISLIKAVIAAKKHTRPTPEATLDQTLPLYNQVLKSRELRATSLKQINLMLNQLHAQFRNFSPHEITSAHLENWFAARNWNRNTIDGVIAKVGPYFTWCVREGYCESNPCGAIKRPKREDKPPAIFSPQDTKKLLQVALKKDPHLVPYLAIGLFAGIRPAEIERLTRKDFLADYIEVTAAKAKTRQRRLVKIAPNLKAWLALRPLGYLCNKRKRLARLLKVTQLTWQPDIMRHSFASYHLALHASAEKTALELGHRDTKMLFAHYRELVIHEESKRYWDIRP